MGRPAGNIRASLVSTLRLGLIVTGLTESISGLGVGMCCSMRSGVCFGFRTPALAEGEVPFGFRTTALRVEVLRLDLGPAVLDFWAIAKTSLGYQSLW